MAGQGLFLWKGTQVGVSGKSGDSGAIPCPEIQHERVTAIWRSSGDIIHCPSWKCSFVFGCGAPCSAGLTGEQCCRKGQLPSDLEDRNCSAPRPCLPLLDGAVLPAPAVFGKSRGSTEAGWFFLWPAEQTVTGSYKGFMSTSLPATSHLGKRGRGFLCL